MADAVVAAMDVQPGRVYVDVTAGAGGHGLALIARLPQPEAPTFWLAWDQDPVAVAMARAQAAQHATLLPDEGDLAGTLDSLALRPGWYARVAHGRFDCLPSLLGPCAPYLLQGRVTGGILADLGTSAMQLETATRGFSFMRPGPLDMRMDPSQPKTAADWVNTASEEALRRIFWEFGEERWAGRIAREIVRQRVQAPLADTGALARLVASCYPPSAKRVGGRKGPQAGGGAKAIAIHPATRVFQALRIAVNDELAVLDALLDMAPDCLAPGARLAVISFHSLEDRRVKRAFQQASASCLCPPGLPQCQCGHRPTLAVLSAKPVTATAAEVAANPRARSAKLRVAQRLPG
jgi:16S rRNA (cytosine1402-N4)-methyltransferase